ncbi:MAG TPA: O-antigen ligase family protein, partial [Bacteroidia bacterium]|nr:O-antigen ligase family protein [Bacteroidia bacterium]
IRFALLICMSIYACIYFIIYSNTKVFYNYMYAVLIIWFVFFLCILQSFTGLIILSVTLGIYVICFLIHQKRWMYTATIFLAIITVLIGLGIKIKNDLDNLNTTKQTTQPLPVYTALGNLYTHERFNGDLENGYPIFVNVAYSELDSAWQTRSSIDFDSVDARGQWIKYTLLRYMTSKGLLKDANGLMQLSETDIKNIEAGIASVNQLQGNSISARYHATLYELNNAWQGGNPSGHSLTMRLLFWKASLHIISNHLLFGVGTGDNKLELDKYYASNTPQLFKQFWLRSHNQFLAIAVSFGLTGLLIFITMLLWPATKLNRWSQFLYVTFFITAICSFLTEDTLETQAGVTFFAFFNTFFLFQNQTPEINRT